jgi:hypothetical protein
MEEVSASMISWNLARLAGMPTIRAKFNFDGMHEKANYRPAARGNLMAIRHERRSSYL